MAHQNRSWDFDLEEGILDAAKLHRVVTQPLSPLSYKQEQDTQFRDTVVTLLLDNSGSMRGWPITIAAWAASWPEPDSSEDDLGGLEDAARVVDVHACTRVLYCSGQARATRSRRVRAKP